jgi:protease I
MAPHEWNLDGKRVAILATHGFEQSELTEPQACLEEAGAEVVVVSPEKDKIRAWKGGDWGESLPVDQALSDCEVKDYDALVLPGGVINPDLLRVNEEALAVIRGFADEAKPIAAICHAPWLLVEAGLAEDRKLTSYGSVKTDVINAGGQWVDEAAVVDKGVITSRDPNDLEAFCDAMIKEIADRPDRILSA